MLLDEYEFRYLRLLTALLSVPADLSLVDADRKCFPSFPILIPLQVLHPTNGDIRHSGHTVAEETDSQTISILTISHLQRQQHHLELGANALKIPNALRSIHRAV